MKVQTKIKKLKQARKLLNKVKDHNMKTRKRKYQVFGNDRAEYHWTKITDEEAEGFIKAAEVEGSRVSFVVAPADQGQIVEVSAAMIGQYGILQRVEDHSEPHNSPTRVQFWIDKEPWLTNPEGWRG